MGSTESIKFVLTWSLKVQDQQQEKIDQGAENFQNFKVWIEAKIEGMMENERRKELEMANFKKKMKLVANAQKHKIENLEIQGTLVNIYHTFLNVLKTT